MPRCGSQTWLCDLPIRFDTYKGCSHDCKYCFASKKHDLNDIQILETEKDLRTFINGERKGEVKWCDWNIPLHWGGVSDPFQPIEKELRNSLKCLKVLAETKYPFVVSTKGRLIAEDEYLELLKQCNVCVQISCACSEHDGIEPGAPTFNERLEIMKKVAPNVKRLIVRVQPFFHKNLQSVLKNIEKFKNAGAYGVIIEGMKWNKKQKGLVKVGSDFTYPLAIIKSDFIKIKDEAHRCGLKIYAGENRLRQMGDSLTCCGIDGLDGFKPNHYNLNHIIRGEDVKPSEKMQEPGTGAAFQVRFQGNVLKHNLCMGQSYTFMMTKIFNESKDEIYTVFGLKR